MFIYEDIVKYSEVDKNGFLPLYGILEYFQNCINLHGLEAGQDYESMDKRKRAWVLIAWKIKISKKAKIYDKVKVGTWSAGFESIYGLRNYVMMDEEDNWIAYADTKWILIDIDTRMPVRVSEEDLRGYVVGDKIPNLESTKRIKLSTDRIAQDKTKVLKTYIDTNNHMNNTAYFRLAQEYIPDDLEYNTVEAVYIKEATEGTVLVPFVHKESNGVGISFESEDGTALTKIKLYKED